MIATLGMRSPSTSTVWNMDRDDWTYRFDDKTLLNGTTLSKLGFHVGEVTLAFRKR